MYRHSTRSLCLRILTIIMASLIAGGFLFSLATDAANISVSGLHVAGNQIENGSGQVVRLLGVDRSGSEYACIQGWSVFDGPSDAASVQAIASWHVNAVRVPLNEDCWLNINMGTSSYGGSTYQQAIENYVSLLNQNSMAAILDLQWTAPGSSQATGLQPMPDQDHAPAFWQSVASTFKGNSSVLFDLFNEPSPDSNQDTTAAWTCLRDGGTCPGVSFQTAGMQELVNTIRGTGATNIIMVPGVQYTNVLDQWLTYEPSDPQHNLAASWHSYAGQVCSPQSCWDQSIAPVAAQVPLVVGEIGENDCGDSYIYPLMNWLDSHGSSYLAWAWDPYGCSFPGLINDYTGAPTSFGQGYQVHLAALAGVGGGSSSVPINKGWNLINVPLQDTGIGSLAAVVADMNAMGQLGPGVITVASSYTNGRFNLYVPGYSADQSATSGIFVYATKSGTWNPAGTAYTAGQTVALQPGWNLTAAPFPIAGISASAVYAEANVTCGVKEVAIYSGGAYSTWMPGQTADVQIPNTSGMWIECASAGAWTPT
jgi:hypothetical protein